MAMTGATMAQSVLDLADPLITQEAAQKLMSQASPLRAKLSDSAYPTCLNTLLYTGTPDELEELIQWLMQNVDGMVEDDRFVKPGKVNKTLSVVLGADIKLTKPQVMLLDSIIESE
jgi:hypothetical protein